MCFARIRYAIRGALEVELLQFEITSKKLVYSVGLRRKGKKLPSLKEVLKIVLARRKTALIDVVNFCPFVPHFHYNILDFSTYEPLRFLSGKRIVSGKLSLIGVYLEKHLIKKTY